MRLKAKILVVTTCLFTFINFPGVFAAPPMSESRLERAKAAMSGSATPSSLSNRKIGRFFNLVFRDPTNPNNIIPEIELRSDHVRMDLLRKFLKLHSTSTPSGSLSVKLPETLDKCIRNYGYTKLVSEIVTEFAARTPDSVFRSEGLPPAITHASSLKTDTPVKSVDTLGSRFLFNEFDKIARDEWSSLSDYSVLRKKINEFLDKYVEKNKQIGGINAQNRYGNTILHHSIRFLGTKTAGGLGNTRMLKIFVECLKEKGIDIEIANIKGNKAEDVVKECHLRAYSILSEKKMASKSFYGKARRKCKNSLFEEFDKIARDEWLSLSDDSILRKKMNEFLDDYIEKNKQIGGINAQNKYGNTILHHSIRFLGTKVSHGLGKPEMLKAFVDCLKQKGIDIEITNRNGNKAKDIAEMYGLEQLIDLDAVMQSAEEDTFYVPDATAEPEESSLHSRPTNTTPIVLVEQIDDSNLDPKATSTNTPECTTSREEKPTDDARYELTGSNGDVSRPVNCFFDSVTPDDFSFCPLNLGNPLSFDPGPQFFVTEGPNYYSNY